MNKKIVTLNEINNEKNNRTLIKASQTESSKDIKRKMKYNIPAVLDGWNENVGDLEEFSQKDFIRYILEEIQTGGYENLDKVAKDLKEVLEMK